jgi:C4-type Zn-finger protein
LSEFDQRGFGRNKYRRSSVPYERSVKLAAKVCEECAVNYHHVKDYSRKVKRPKK